MLRLFIYLLCCQVPWSALSAQYVFTPVDKDGETCTSARFLSGVELDNLTGTLNTAYTPGVQPANYCGSSSAENIEWYSFLASDTDVHLEIDFSSCSGGVSFAEGFQAGVYRGCDFVNDDIICVTQNSINGTIVLQFTTSPGLHYLFFDGFGGSVCDYEVNVIAGICTDPFAVLNAPDATCHPVDANWLQHDTVTVCLGNEQTIRPDLDFPPVFDFCDVLTADIGSLVDGEPFYSIETIVSAATGYTFLSGESVQVSYTSPRGTVITEQAIIRWDTPGIYQVSQEIRINPYLPSSLVYDTTCTGTLTVIVEEYDTIALPPDTICAGSNYPFCGDMYTTSQLITCDDPTTCTRTTLSLVVIPQETVDLGTIYLCPDSCFAVYDINYCSAGSYSDAGSDFCDTIYNFTLEDLELSQSITGDSILSCMTGSTTLAGNITTNYPGDVQQYWTNSIGDTISEMPEVTITSGGTYTYHAQPVGYSCSSSSSIQITTDDVIPSATLTPPLLSCAMPTGTIGLASAANITSYDWTGPQGFASGVAEPTVADTGKYNLTIIAANGCQLDTSVTVMGDYQSPIIDMTYQDLDCAITSGTATYSTADITSDSWLLPSGGVATGQSITYSDTGLYILVLEAANGCTADSTFHVSDATYDPTIAMHKDSMWRCNTQDISYSYISNTDYNLAWTTTDGTLGATSNSGMTALGPGTYVVAITDAVTSCVGWDTVAITPDTNALEVIWYSESPTCYGDSDGSIHIDLLSGLPPYSVSINESVVSAADMTALPADSYYVVISDTYGCQRDTTIIIANPDEVLITIDPSVDVKYADDVTLQVIHSVPDERLGSITWVDSENQILGTSEELTIVALADGKYGVAVSDLNGCRDSVEVLVTVDRTIEVWAPSIFSPNGDNNNDRWYLSSDGLPESLQSIQIYARWGEVVYDQQGGAFGDASSGWDGSHQGRPCTPGVYVYRGTYIDANGLLQSTAGTITLVR